MRDERPHGAWRERRIVARFHSVTHRETEAGADVVEVVIARSQNQTRQASWLSQVDLHPFDRVGRGGNLAVITEFGLGISFRRFGRFGDLSVEVDERLARLLTETLVERRETVGSFPTRRRQLSLTLSERRVGVVLPIGSIERREDGLERVIVFLSERIEFVVVALSAVNRHAAKGSQRVSDHVVAIEVTSDFAVDLRFGHFGVSDEIPGTGRDKSERLDAVARSRIQHVARDLFFNEASVRTVLVQRADDVIAVRPGVRT